jgi:hypothetical protein
MTLAAETGLLDDYSGPFEPDFTLSRLSRAALSIVARELMLASHLQDRAAVPAVLGRHPMDDAWAIAIDEWMTASPMYTRRMQRLMGFEGTGMSTIFKGLQLDMGFPHQFLDVGYRLHGEADGEFWLRSCGALSDVRPMGVDMIRGMCHDIEDPTFDATAIATNARAQVRPIHRPPEVPRGGPDCHWTVRISDEHPEVTQHPGLARMERTHLAAMTNDPPPSAEPGGWEDYAGEFDPHLELEDLAHRALVLVATEFALQGHAVARGCMWSVESRFGVDEAIDVGRQLFCGVAGIGAERLVPALGITDDSAAAIGKVLQVCHVTLLRDHLGLAVSMPDDDTVLVALAADSPALAEGDAFSVAGLLDAGGVEILEALAGAVNPCAVVAETSPPAGARAAWTISIGDEPRTGEPDPVTVARFSNGVSQVFLRRRPLRS